ncbi:MAG: SAM-dependent methyltransferase [Labedaea sp.]
MQASPGKNDVDLPSVARMHDYWLGGSHNTEGERTFADHLAMVGPLIPYLVRTQRALLGRIVRYLLGQGVRQFVDIGSGLPTCGQVHEIAEGSDPPARVLYVDNDPAVAADGQDLLAGNENAAFLAVDFREPARVLSDPAAQRLLDPQRPVALLAIAALQQIPDSDDPVGVVAGYLRTMCSGSYLALTHSGPDPQLAYACEMFEQMKFGPRHALYLRDAVAVRLFFAGLELAPPGIVPVPLWHPDPERDPVLQNPERVPVNVGVARKP